MSKRILKKDSGLPSQIRDVHHPPNTFGTTLFVICPWGGGSHRLQTFVFAAAKNCALTLMFRLTPKMTKRACAWILATSARRGKKMTVAALKRKSCWRWHHCVVIDDCLLLVFDDCLLQGCQSQIRHPAWLEDDQPEEEGRGRPRPGEPRRQGGFRSRSRWTTQG